MTSGSGFNNTDILAQSAGQKVPTRSTLGQALSVLQVVEACTRNEFDTAMRIARQGDDGTIPSLRSFL
jgi:hypothetical protein